MTNHTNQARRPGRFIPIENRLLPCPFCGEAVNLYDGDTIHHPEGECLLEGDLIDLAKWNTRALTTPDHLVVPCAECEKLKHDLRRCMDNLNAEVNATRLAVGDEPTCDTCGAKQSDENEYCSDVFHAPWARSGDEPTEAMVEAGADIAAMEVGDQWTGRGEYCRLATAIWKAMRNAETKGEG